MLVERTPALDALKTGVYELRQYRTNSCINNEQVNHTFVMLIESFTKTRNLQKTKRETAAEKTKKDSNDASKKTEFFAIPRSSQIAEMVE